MREIERGSIVRDIEERDELIAVQVLSKRSDKYVIRENQLGNECTVHDFNKRYPRCSPSDPVVEAVYSEHLDFEPSEFELDRYELSVLAESSGKVYAFPISRLESI